jgi:hypothetical protein
MARPKSKLNQANSKVIEDNILKENPEGLPSTEDLNPVQVVKVMPQMETIIFRNDRDPGVMHEFHYHSKTHRLAHYKLHHGKEYTLPREVVEHLEDRKIPIYGYRKGPDGHPEMYITSYKYYFQCKPVRDNRAA